MIATLRKLEPKFFAAGQLALRLQKNIKLQKKSQTGNVWADAVTEADFLVQEFLLREMAKTKLVNCRLLAEEKTDFANKFDPAGKFFLNIDPIDGTRVYAAKKPCFSIIVGLHDGKSLLYTFKYHPAFNWGHIIIRNRCKQIGNSPNLNLQIKNKKIITFVHKSDQLGSDLRKKLIQKGYKFIFRDVLGEYIGGTTMFLAGQVDGIFQCDPNAYDGLVALHFAQAKNFKIYEKIDLSRTKTTKFGEIYQGWYLVLKK
jgi:fructose-1,6-bisphosphatase/inositol monophosphatase family enzyme